MNNPVFGKNIKILNLSHQKGVCYLVSEPDFHTTKFFTETLLAIKMKKKMKYLTEWTFLLRRFNSTIK